MSKYSFNLLKADQPSPLEVLIPILLALLLIVDAALIYSSAGILRTVSHGVVSARPDLERTRSAAARIKALNEITPETSFRMHALFNGLEKVLPDEAMIQEIRVSPKGAVKLTGTCSGSLALKKLMENLSAKPFSAPFLENQKLSDGKLIFRVECRFEG
ncbi:MAG: PilN domain-containing protein [Candidatus Wallbacteria bacterium]|nr:PilN domain-containing protein [Candidatus Wallbacteria bacterium]